MHARLDEYHQWVDTIQKYYLYDNRLEREGAFISEKEIKTDGPFLESKEIIAGFIVLQAQSLQQATDLAQSSPLLRYFDILVRPIIEKES